MPGSSPYRELTPASVIVSVFVGCAMCVAFTYTGLKLGFTLAGSTIAAILGFGLLKGGGKLLGRRDFGSILEVNIAQTGASAINVASSGVTFTLPALFLIGNDITFNPLAAILAAVAGTLLGLVVIAPLRKQMVEFDRLRFPSGLAVSSILKAPGESTTKALIMLAGLVISAGVYSLTQNDPGFDVLPEKFNVGKEWFGLAEQYQLVFSLSLVNVAAGLLAARGGLPFLAGGILAWLVVSPIAFSNGWLAGVTEDKLSRVTNDDINQPLGIGILVGGAIMGVILSAPALKAAIQSLFASTRASGGSSDEVPGKLLGFGLVGGIALLFVASWQGADLGPGQAILTAIVGTAWLGLAGLVVAQATGMTDISPISGMALIGVTLMVLLLGSGGSAMVPAILIGCGSCDPDRLRSFHRSQPVRRHDAGPQDRAPRRREARQAGDHPDDADLDRPLRRLWRHPASLAVGTGRRGRIRSGH